MITENKIKGRSNKQETGRDNNQARGAFLTGNVYFEYMMIASESIEPPLNEDSRVIYVTKHFPFQNSVCLLFFFQFAVN